MRKLVRSLLGSLALAATLAGAALLATPAAQAGGYPSNARDYSHNNHHNYSLVTRFYPWCSNSHDRNAHRYYSYTFHSWMMDYDR